MLILLEVWWMNKSPDEKKKWGFPGKR